MFEFGVVDSLDAVPDKYKSLYAEVTEGDDAGKFAVSSAFQDFVGEYVGTNKALATARADKKSAGDESAKRRLALKAFDDIMEGLGIDENSRTADGLKAHIDEIAAQAKNGKELKVDLDKVREEMTKKFQTQLEAKDAEIGKKDSALQKFLVKGVAGEAITKHGGASALLSPIVEKACKVVELEDGDYAVRVVDGSGDVRYNGSGNPMTIGEYVETLKTSEDYAMAFKSEERKGSGKNPGSSANPAPRQNSQQKPINSTAKIAAGLTNFGKR